jgi:hypothetical protein
LESIVSTAVAFITIRVLVVGIHGLMALSTR